MQVRPHRGPRRSAAERRDPVASRAGATSTPSVARRRARTDRRPRGVARSGPSGGGCLSRAGIAGGRARARRAAEGAAGTTSGGSSESIRAATASSVEASSRRSRNANLDSERLVDRRARLGQEQRVKAQLDKGGRRVQLRLREARQLGKERLQPSDNVRSTRPVRSWIPLPSIGSCSPRLYASVLQLQ